MPYFKTEMHQIRFRLGLRPRFRLGELAALPQTSLLDLRGPTLKGRVKERGEGKKGDREGRGKGKGKGGDGQPPNKNSGYGLAPDRPTTGALPLDLAGELRSPDLLL